jgi:predicted nucleic acid-binding protein
MTIVDSSVWIEYLKDRDTAQTVWLRSHIDVDRIGLPDLILYELLQGTRGDAEFKRLRERLADFERLSTMTPGLEVKAAQNYRRLRQRGITVRTSVDCLVATFCIEGDHELLHNDSDFDGFEKHLGLKVIHPRSAGG